MRTIAGNCILSASIGGVNFHAAGRMRRMLDVELPGPASLEPATLPYRRACRDWLSH
jgi:hypothetical protein